MGTWMLVTVHQATAPHTTPGAEDKSFANTGNCIGTCAGNYRDILVHPLLSEHACHLTNLR